MQKGVFIMPEYGHFSVNDFATYSRTTRDTLLHYERIGLLTPASRGDNNYRYYSETQLTTLNVIRTLQQLGMTLEEIKAIQGRRTPELSSEVLAHQIERIDHKIEEWVRARKLLHTIQKTIQSVSDIDESAMTIQFLPAEAIVIGGLNDYSRGRCTYDALLSFYSDISERYPEMDLNYFVWGLFSEQRIKQGEWDGGPDRFYFFNPEGHDKRPAALYAIGYIRGGYGQGDALYKRLIEYIERNGFEVCGPAYEEYPLNEVCISEDENYLMRVMIMVREKG